jgi:hypothetical protein
MTAVETALAILGSIVTVLTPAAGLGCWVYRRGWASGYKAAERAALQAHAMARIEALERQLAEAREQPTAIQQSRLRSGHT